MAKKQGIFKYFPIDIGGDNPKLILSGMGRSGTTLVGNILNANNRARILFEPFFPDKVKEACDFEYIQYLRKEDPSPRLMEQAKKILSGSVKGNWVDRDNNKLVYTSRIIKDIRCNLMLAWLKAVAGNPPVVLVVRHPLQVYASWKKLGWGKQVDGQKTDTQIILDQSQITEDFPIIKKVLSQIDLNDYIQNIIFQWCMYHIVPFSQLSKEDAYVLFYENLLRNPDEELNLLSLYLNESFHIETVKKILSRSSSTNFREREFSKDNTVNSWKDELSAGEIEKALKVMTLFGLDGLYDASGLPASHPLLSANKATA